MEVPRPGTDPEPQLPATSQLRQCWTSSVMAKRQGVGLRLSCFGGMDKAKSLKLSSLHFLICKMETIPPPSPWS